MRGLNRVIFSRGVPRTFLNYLLLPAQFVLHPERFSAERPLFPLVIVWPLAWLIAWRDRSVRWWTCWVLAFTALWFAGAQELRYWVPALPLAGLALCESLGWIIDRVGRSMIFQRVVWTSLMLAAVLWGAHYTLTDIQLKRWPPVRPAARDGFLTSFVGGYEGAKFINEHADPSDVVYVMNASWLCYHLQTRAIDLGALLEGFTPSLSWPEDEPWVRGLEARQVKWLLVYHLRPWSWMRARLPKDNPSFRPFWPPYQLVYEDPQVWVYHRSPTQGE